MKADLLKSVYDEKLNNLWVTSTEGVDFLKRCLDGHVPSEGVEDIIATYYAEIYGQDGDKGYLKNFLRAKDNLNVANLENAENGLPLCEPTSTDIGMEQEALTGSELIEDAHQDLHETGEFSIDTITRIREFGADPVEDSAQDQ